MAAPQWPQVAQRPNGQLPKAPPSTRACTAYSRPSRRLCTLSQPESGELYDVCETCYLCEEIRRLASRLPEETSTSETLREGLATLYALARSAVEERQQNVSGSRRSESEGEGEGESQAWR